MSFYTSIAAAVVAQQAGGYCPPPPPQKPSFWDSWKAGVLVFLITLGILAGLLYAMQPSKPSKYGPVPQQRDR